MPRRHTAAGNIGPHVHKRLHTIYGVTISERIKIYKKYIYLFYIWYALFDLEGDRSKISYKAIVVYNLSLLWNFRMFYGAYCG